MKRARPWILAAAVLALAGLVGVPIALRLAEPEAERADRGGPRAAPVEVAGIERGPIVRRRVFSGTLEATARITVAPKVGGRLISMPVDLSDEVERGQVVAELDNDEYVQEAMQAEAEVAVAEAGLVEASNAAEIAERELERVRTLHERGVASASQLDTATAAQLAGTAAVEVAKARVTRAEAALRSARIRQEYATIRASWEGGDDVRVVAERFAEEGDTIAANTPILSVIELDPIQVVVYATEREYALLEPDQRVTLGADAYPGESWSGRVSRISPVFEEGSRQARVEIVVPNERGRLKPGMFVRVDAILGASVRRPVFATMVTLIVVTIGLVSLQRLRIDLLPAVEMPTLTVRTSYEGASPEVMERLVTQIVEEILATVPAWRR
jgi:RND family efflux transporter MFP subunit